MLRKDSDHSGSIEKEKLLVMILKGLGEKMN
jgi:hypothetical protein